MAWTAPNSYDVGETLTAASLNEQLSGNSQWLFDRIISAAATNGSQNVNTSYGTFCSVSLAAGTWAVFFQASCENPAGGGTNDNFPMRIRNTTDSVTYAEWTIGDTGGTSKRVAGTIAAQFIITATKTVTGQIRCVVGGGAQSNASSLLAIRVDMP